MLRILWQVAAFVILCAALPLAFAGVLCVAAFIALAATLVAVFEYLD